MPLIQCFECNHEISSEAKTCPSCGAKQKKKGMGLFAKISLGFIGAFCFFALLGALNSNVKTDPKTFCNNAGYDAIDLSHRYVSRFLKAPTTATFQPRSEATAEQLGPDQLTKLDENSKELKKAPTKLGMCVYQVKSYVDSQNSFGAVIRTKYTAIILMTPRDDGGVDSNLISLDHSTL